MATNKTRIAIFWLITAAALIFGVVQTATRAARGTASSGDIVINEFVAANAAGLTDADGETSDWVELYNQGDLPVNLAGWALTDNPNLPEKWRLPDMTLAGRAYLVVFASGKNRTGLDRDGRLHANFKLRRSGEFLGLYNILEDKFIDTVPAPFPQQYGDIAYGRAGDQPRYAYLANPTPGQPNDETVLWEDRVAPVSFSVERGLYDKPFTVSLSSATPGATIRYTTNGSEPTGSGGTLYSGPVTVSGTTLLRATAFHPDFLPAQVETHSYIFLDKVLSQPVDPAGFPDVWGQHAIDFAGYSTGDPVQADYAVDPDLVNHPRYKEHIREGLRAIPSLSIVTDAQNFDIYANPRERGVAWERPASIELIYPEGQRPGFQANAGVRIQGGAGRWEFMPKHSFRLFFRNEYGAARLEYPLFPDSPVEKFDTLVLRAGVDRSYAGHPEVPDHRLATYTRDEWLRASQIEMSGSGAHGIFVHLYLNGLYWGLYNLIERPDAAFASAYFGGPEQTWYSVNHRGTLSGSSDRFKRLIQLAETGRLDQPEIYAEVASLLDLEQFADYLILNWYAGTKDWPENNWYGAMSNPEGRLRYFVWDGEESWNDGAIIHLGKDDLAGVPNTIKILFEALIENPDFRLTLADRMARHLFNDGALTDAKAQSRWQAINMPLAQAIIGESIRWGDARYDEPITPKDWQRAYQDVLAQMEGNGARLMAQARNLGYYPAIDPPQFSQSGGLVAPGFQLEMTLPETARRFGEATIYFTTDGSDPRLPSSGAIATTAAAYQEPVNILGPLQIRARVRVEAAVAKGLPVWSAMQAAVFNIELQQSQLRLTEIMYHPVEGGDYEFIELTNSGKAEAALAGASFSGIRYTFPPNTAPLASNERRVLVRNAAAFRAKYPDVPVAGVYEGQLSNGGEEIILSDSAGRVLVAVAYDDARGWPLTPDGHGDSLVLVDPAGDPQDPHNWRASSRLNGSPGADDVSP